VRRRVLEEDKLVAALAPLGFVELRPERLSIAEQAALFAEAEIIVGPTGGAMTNMLFMQPGARAVVLYNNVMLASGDDLYFDALAETCGLRFAAVPAYGAASAEGRVIDADIKVAAAEVLAAVEKLLS
jgi:capsular polysaccharide biosynthesis protein